MYSATDADVSSDDDDGECEVSLVHSMCHIDLGICVCRVKQVIIGFSVLNT
jgi:hypothetical protein